MHMSGQGRPVHIIGAGPGGLATAAALRQRGIRAVVLEKSPAVGASWRSHYDRLRLHTTRRWSSLPGLPLPRAYGRWVTRGDLVRYLEAYADHHRIELAAGVEVDRIDRAGGAEGAGGVTAEGAAGGEVEGWTLHANGGRKLSAPAVVVATGSHHTARLPDWPGRRTFTGDLLHSSRYRNAAPYRGKDVFVVGAGNSGAEIAVDLADGGARRVRLAVRTPPHLVRRSFLGWPAQASGVLCRRLPTRLGDRLADRTGPLATPDLTPYGLPRPETGLYTRARRRALPVVDAGLVGAVRKRRVEPVAAVESFDGDKVTLADGTAVSPDVVIAATGYTTGLEPLVGHLGVLDDTGRPLAHGRRTHPDTPGLFFTGYTAPLSGILREIARDADRIARAIARQAA